MEEVLAAGVGLRRVGERQPQSIIDHLPPSEIVPVDECHRYTGGAGPAGAPDAVQVCLLVIGAAEIHHVSDRFDVDASCGDVGGHQDVDLPVPEGAKCALADRLSQIAVYGSDRETTAGEVVGQLLRGALG
jgi:hypothetical protein